jgi:rfaE bifunctional protein kinase chain/domain
MPTTLLKSRARKLLSAAERTRILVVGDLMLDQFIWGNVSRISPEAPVPIVDFHRESLMPGGAANVARNLSSLRVGTALFGIVGHDEAAAKLRRLLHKQGIGCDGVIGDGLRTTSVKTRIVAHQQQVVRVDRESRDRLDTRMTQRLIAELEKALSSADAVILADYGKGVVTQELLNALREKCRQRGLWLSLDPKPVHRLDLGGLSLLTPNRKEAFELAGITDETRHADPLKDAALLRVADTLLTRLRPALLLITLGEHGILLCRRDAIPFHIPTVAQEVFDVSGAGDTVIASFTLAIAAGASPIEAAILSNHAAGIVVGKVGTATVTPDELLASFA